MRRAVAAGVKHVVRRELLQLERHLGTVRILERMRDGDLFACPCRPGRSQRSPSFRM